jgi:hypothetical protein
MGVVNFDGAMCEVLIDKTPVTGQKVLVPEKNYKPKEWILTIEMLI